MIRDDNDGENGVKLIMVDLGLPKQQLVDDEMIRADP